MLEESTVTAEVIQDTVSQEGREFRTHIQKELENWDRDRKSQSCHGTNGKERQVPVV